MRLKSRAFALGFFIVAVAGCAAIQQQKAAEVRADQGEFKNLKVFPQNITHDELIAAMRTFTRSLGVKCDHCHAAAPVEPGAKEHLDFASDAKPEKNTARVMMRMTRDANMQVSKVNEHGTNVTCYTCHRGKVIPESTLPAEPAK
jgi:hypothetical protein